MLQGVLVASSKSSFHSGLDTEPQYAQLKRKEGGREGEAKKRREGGREMGREREGREKTCTSSLLCRDVASSLANEKTERY